jgi:triphosphoribosyl-dephospho-CoA synthase
MPIAVVSLPSRERFGRAFDAFPSCACTGDRRPARWEKLAAKVTHVAYRALLHEVLLTPKPGLVDRRNTGAHRDMDVYSFIAGARAISPWFRRFFAHGLDGCDIPAEMFLPTIRPEGMACEQAMLRATGGVNTHKGGIFAFGLLCAAAGRLTGRGRLLTREELCAEVARMCAGILGELRRDVTATTAGEHIFRRHGLTGARGEAQSGFATVRRFALPAYEWLRAAGAAPATALHGALLELLAFNPDTNLVARGGMPGLAFIQGEALRLRDSGGVRAANYLTGLAALDDTAIARNLSPGGTADLLAVTWFLSRFPAGEARQ